MAIRIRVVGGTYVALCAAISEEKIGDLYLDDGMHEALSTKFNLDLHSMGCLKGKPCVDERKIPLMKQEQGGKLV